MTTTLWSFPVQHGRGAGNGDGQVRLKSGKGTVLYIWSWARGKTTSTNSWVGVSCRHFKVTGFFLYFLPAFRARLGMMRKKGGYTSFNFHSTWCFFCCSLAAQAFCGTICMQNRAGFWNLSDFIAEVYDHPISCSFLLLYFTHDVHGFLLLFVPGVQFVHSAFLHLSDTLLLRFEFWLGFTCGAWWPVKLGSLGSATEGGCMLWVCGKCFV